MSNYPDFSNFNTGGYRTEGTVVTSNVSAVMRLVYLKMTIALIVTGLVSWFAAGSAAYWSFMASHSWFMWVLIVAELGIVLGISAGLNKLSSLTATALFYIFAVINGLMLSSIFLVYKLPSIATTFFITAGTFGAMSVYGYFTNRDLSKMGSILFMALIGVIIATLVNMFLKSDGLMWVISFLGVIIFVGLTAWDTQNIKNLAYNAPASMTGHVATLGALSLYLDFINLFLYLLRFFGSSRD